MTTWWDHIDWTQVAAFIGLVGIFAGGVSGLARLMLGRDFVTKKDHAIFVRGLQSARDALEERMGSIEDTVRSSATKNDIATLAVRLTPLELSVAVIQERVINTNDRTTDTQRMVQRLVEAQLTREERK